MRMHNSMSTLPDPVELVKQSDAFAPHERYYWGYQFLLATHVLVPLLRQQGVFREGMRVFEFGCGEAGVLGAFAHAGAQETVGADISAYRIEVGRRIAGVCGLPLQLEVRDLLSDSLPSAWHHHFDVVLLRDVIEHLDSPSKALQVVRELLSPCGAVLVTFPPYYSPFGGHQHLLQTRSGMIPWVHVLPKPLFEWIIRRSSRPADQEEVRRLRHIRLTIRRFEQAVHQTGFVVAHRSLYLLRPVFRFKFGLPALQLPAILSGSILAEMCAMEALYILRPGRQEN